MDMDKKACLSGGIYGLLIGDTLGVPYEFHASGEIPPLDAIDFTPPSDFERSHRKVLPGTWSDDGALALCLLASLLDTGKVDSEDMGQRFVAFRESGYMAVDQNVFDIGGTTEDALDLIQKGIPALQAGRSDEWSQGNGSLMRVLPLALWHKGDDGTLIHDAENQSRITHAHPSALVCCGLYCLWARRTIEGIPDAWMAAVHTYRTLFGLDTMERIILEEVIRPEHPYRIRGSGFVVDTLHSAHVVQQAGDYAAIVRAAIALGNDTDTTACVAGGIAGLRLGIEKIPAHWRFNLRGRDLVNPLIERLIAWHQ
jgi:ADP-ribosyl-[dinitrogen reductase] hydrolase